MSRKAIRDTFGIETIGGVEIRRRIVAGQVVPQTYDVDPADVEDSTGSPTGPLGTVTKPKQKAAPSVSDLTVDEMRDEVRKRREAGEEIDIEEPLSKARRADLLKALGG